MIVVMMVFRRFSKIEIARGQFRFLQQIADGFDAAVEQSLMGFGTDAGNHFHSQRREKIFFRAGGNVDQPMGFRQGRGDLGDHPAGR